MELTGFESRSGVLGGMPRFVTDRPFSDFLTSLDRHGEPPSPQALDRVLKGLRHALRSEIRRRGLLETSPNVLGLVGFEHWSAGWMGPQTAASRDRDALDELAVDCYVYIFVTRLRSLLAQLKAKGNVEGLVRRSVRNFVHDTQRRHDPLGFRVFKLFRRAVEEAVKIQRLFVLEPNGRLCNDTLLGFHPGSAESQSLDEGVDLTDTVARWNDRLLPDLMTARGPQTAAVVETFRDQLLSLEAEGVSWFRCRDVIDPLKADARRRWATLWSQGEGKTLIGDEADWSDKVSGEDQDSFMALSSCVDRRLKEYPGQQRSRSHLLKLWEYLKRFAMADVEDGREQISWQAMQGKLPSHRELSKLLEIPRERFPDLYETIRQATQTCQAHTKSNHALRVVKETPPCTARRSVMKDRRDELLQQTGEAYRRLQTESSDEGIDIPSPVGKLLALSESSDLGLEWLVLEAREDGCWRMVPADPHPWLGSADWALQDETLGPLTLRCREDHWLDQRTFVDAVESADVNSAELQAIRRHMANLDSIVEQAGDERLDVDQDPEYMEWCRRIHKMSKTLACRQLPDTAGDDAEEDLSQQRGASLRGVRSRGLGDGFLARAAMVLLVVGVAHWSGRLMEVSQWSGKLDRLGVEKSNLAQRFASLEARTERLTLQLGEQARGILAGGKSLALIDGGQVRSGAERIELSADDAWLLMLIDLPPLEEGDRLRIVRRDDGDVVWQDPNVGLRDSAERNIQFVPSAACPTGITCSRCCAPPVMPGWRSLCGI